jgi:hypothetical protein
MPWGAAIGAVGAIVGGSIQSSGAKSAANAQAQSAAAATAEQQREFDYIQQIYGPQRNLGYGADQKLAGLFGMSNPMGASPFGNPDGSGGGGGGPGGPLFGNLGDRFAGGRGGPMTASGRMPSIPNAPGGQGGGVGGGQPDYSGFFNSPGYQFTLNTGENAMKHEASATGGLYSTNTMLGLNTFAQGQAATHYNDYVQQLLQMAGLGGAAVSGTGAAAMNTGNNISANTLSAGNANASGALGSANAWSNATNQIAGMDWNKIISNINSGTDAGAASGYGFGG